MVNDSNQQQIPITQQEFQNECGVVTIFEMGVKCVALQPTTITSNDGALSLEISGGTPPYTTTWANGNISPAISNLSVGSYGVTVVDYYGDFTATTVCVLTGQTIPEPTTTTTTTIPVPTGPDFCMTASIQYVRAEVEYNLYINNEFQVDSFVNGKPSWISDDNLLRVYWETSPSQFWNVSGITPGFVSIVNLDPTDPPINASWVVQGGSGTISVFQGPCSSPIELSPFKIANPNISLYVVTNDPICGCGGSIMADADGGNIPYQYSIDGGLTYKRFPIFDNLCSGIYTVNVIDSSGFTKSTQVLLNPPQDPTTYSIGLSKISTVTTNTGLVKNTQYEVTVNVTPPLPPTTTITFDLIHTNTLQVSTSESSASQTTNTVLGFNESAYTYSYSSTTTGTTTNIINGCQDQLVYVTSTSEVWEGLTYSQGDEIVINTSSTVVKNFTNGCDFGDSTDEYYLTNVRISGCNCCTVENISV